ncbi:hypothetical protein ANO11243_014270 [Dothideomycetidae sp. 11243]|nr:hypothetical protein ANO11243_014270 [fungal sp. No.11243]
MPSGQSRNPLKNFRRKSAGNALDLQQPDNPVTPPAQSSFRVLERPEKGDSRDRSSTIILGRPATLPVQHPHAKSVDNLGYNNSGYYDTSGSSARHSSSSTLPSSLDAEHDPDHAPAPQAQVPHTIAPASVPEPPPSFAARAGRAFSFASNTTVPPVPSTFARPQRTSPAQDRTLTTSSYASTAKPPQLDSNFGTADFGDDDFGNMFDGIKKNNIPSTASVQLAATKAPSSQNVRMPSSGPDSNAPPRAASRPTEMPSPNLLERPQGKERRYSWDSRKSSEQLISGESSALGSPTSELFPSAPKAAAVPGLPNFANLRGYDAVPNRYHNSGFLSPQSIRDNNPSQESLRGLTSSVSRERSAWAGERPRADLKSTPSRQGLRQLATGSNSHGRGSPSGSDTVVPSHDGSAYEQDDTPRPRKSLVDVAQAASLFEGSPTSPASRIISMGKQRGTPAVTPSATPKKMTKAQFEQASKMRNSAKEEEKSEASDTEDLDDEDEVDKQKKIAAQRRRQEATMSVYRQQMKKVTGGSGQLSDLPLQTGRGTLERSSNSNLSLNMSNLAVPGQSTSPGFSPGDAAGDDEDDEVPLGILQAHGFPGRARPPSHLAGSQPGYASSMMGDGSGGPLPAFARRLPPDPYFGAGLVNPGQRESLGLGSSGASVYGGPASPQMQSPPGGLVGVIANEERSRAGRRGSPNPVTGGYGPIPLPGSMQGNAVPQFTRSSSTLSLQTPQMGMPGYGMMPGPSPGMSPVEQQMAQLMQMQQHVMQQMMALSAGQTPGGQMSGGQMGYPFPMTQSPSMNSLGQRPLSTVSNGRPASIAQTRSMTMLQPPSNWGSDMAQKRTSTMSGVARSQYAGSVYGLSAGGPGPGYTPSIAPSERSNVGMPSRYRPVSIMEPADSNPGDRRSKTMTSLSPQTFGMTPARSPSPVPPANGNASKPKSTIRILEKLKGTPKSNLLRPEKTDDDEDEAGWAQMARKKEAMRQKRATRHHNTEGAALADLYQGLDD